MPALLFNRIHGVNVRINEDGRVAERVSNDSGGGILFSNRPVQLEEKVCIRFMNVSTDGYAGLRFGFSMSDPSSLQSALGFYTGLATRPEFWAKDLWLDSCKKDNVLYFSVNGDGDVSYGINGEEKEVFLYELKARGNRWVLLEVFGQSTQIQFVDDEKPSPRGNEKVIPSNFVDVQSTCTTTVPSLVDNPYVVPGTSSTNNVTSSTSSTILSFHRTKGEDVQVLGGGNRASRPFLRKVFSITKSLTCSYVFTSRSINIGECFVVKVKAVDKRSKYKEPSMIFGVTSCNPDSISSRELPRDPNALLDRKEYWIIKDNLVEDIREGDQIAFTFSYSGEISMSRNKGSSQTLVHVDNSVPLWAFFDLCGAITEIQLVECRHDEGNKGEFWSLVGEGSAAATPTATPATTPLEPEVPMSPLPSAPETVLIDFSEDAEIVTSSSFPPPKTVPMSMGTAINSSSPPSDSVYVECVTCCNRRVDSVFLPCGHMCMCYPCAVTYWKAKIQTDSGQTDSANSEGCPICRSSCTGVIRTYNS